MFSTMNTLNIGTKNVDAVKVNLARNRIRLIAEDVGGSCGRRINFNILTGIVTVKRFNGEVTKI